ncbi:circadian input kinase A [Pseudanabaena sp. lw0831]|uniref:PAS domain S-box protein n=1 Tax=Pseudanabaena sp. lw0831 TaxID=1357935 RepID=UPI001916532B|nr:PAS domain S-box protein [Pseudanabaena sp. lw0831]GBO52343.1 circadian input kinase A [Pseudanabaena sp. lw0831]
MKSTPNSQDILSAIEHNPLVVAPDTHVIDAIAMMSEVGSSYVLVHNDQRMHSQGMGIFTERDIIRINAQRLPINDLQIQSVMSHPVVTIQASDLTDINDALAQFQEFRINHLPVLDGDRLVGVLAKDSLTEILAQKTLQHSSQLSEQTQALKISEERWQLALKGANDGIWDFDMATNKVFYSSRWKQMRGFDDDEIGDSLNECSSRIHPDDYDRVIATANDHLAGKTEFVEMEYRALCKNGSYIWVLERGQALRNEFGQPIRVIGSDTDISAHKLIESKLIQSEAQFRCLVEGGLDLIWSSDQNGLFTYLSPQFKSLFGWESSEWIGKSYTNLVHPDDRLRVKTLEFMENVESGKKSCHPEFRHLHRDGHYIWVRANSTTILNPDGVTIGSQGTLTDISDRKQAEAKLQAKNKQLIQSHTKLAQSIANIQRSNALLTVLQEASFDGILVIDEHRRVITYNQRFLNQWDIPQSLVLSTGDLQLFDIVLDRLADPHEFLHQVEHLYDHPKDISHSEIRRKDDKIFDLYSAPIYWSNDRYGRAWFFRDISDRKRLEQEQTRLISILEASTDYISMADANGMIFWKNAELKRLCGIDPKHDIKQYQISDCHPQWAADVVLQKGLPYAIALGSWMGETALLNVEGQEIPVSQLILAHKSPQGEIEFFSFIMRDIQTRKEYEQKLELTNAELLRATRLKDEFLATMSHELRTPLNSILGMTEALQEQILGGVNEKQLKALKTVETSGLHLLALINDILDLAKIESGQFQLDYNLTNVALVCQSSITFIQNQAFNKHIKLEIKISPNLPALQVDERRIRQVLLNLLSNAVKFTPKGGRITLEVKQLELQEIHTSSWIRIAVIDTGIGISPENIPKLFQPFIQIDGALNRQYAGTGLGLSLVKRMVELHGGIVGLTSDLGIGSCFTVDLPCITSLQEAIADVSLNPTSDLSSPVSAKANLSPLILIAEDNEANISTLTDYLEANRYRILIAMNGQEAIALTKTHQPDLILMDIQMPIMDGLEAIKQIRLDPSFTNIPIIALTALAMAGDRQKCIDAGANEYIAKPIKLKALSQMIQSFLAP